MGLCIVYDYKVIFFISLISLASRTEQKKVARSLDSAIFGKCVSKPIAQEPNESSYYYDGSRRRGMTHRSSADDFLSYAHPPLPSAS